MTSLTIDAVGRRTVGRRIAVVAEDAALIDEPREIGRGRVVVAWTHPPAPFLRIPGDRKLCQLSSLRLVEIGAGMIARTDRVCRFLLVDVHFGAARVHLKPALVYPPAAAQHLITPAR